MLSSALGSKSAVFYFKKEVCMYTTSSSITLGKLILLKAQYRENFAGLRVELQAAPCLPCSKLGVKRGHCATIPLSLSIAAVEASSYWGRRGHCGGCFAAATSILLFLVVYFLWEVAQRPWPLFLCSFPAKKGGIYDDDTYAASEAIFGLLRLCFSYPRQPDSIISKVGLVLRLVCSFSVGCSSLNLFFVVSTWGASEVIDR